MARRPVPPLVGEGMVTRRLVLRAKDVAFAKGVVEAHDGLAVECTARAIAVRGDEGEVIQVLFALHKKPGTKGYSDRMMDSIDQLAPLQAARPRE